LLQPAEQWVPTGEDVVHQPSLMIKGEGCIAVSASAAKADRVLLQAT
jgi:hypothetical protein